jgi:hypothetical protein
MSKEAKNSEEDYVPEPPELPQEQSADWESIQKEFDSLDNIDDILIFLRKITDQLKICENTECKIFPEINHLDLLRTDFKRKTIKDAETQITNAIELKRFKMQFREYIIAAKHTFSKIFAMKSAQDTKFKTTGIYHDRILEVINALIQSNHPIPIEVGQGINTYLSMNSRMGDSSEELKEYNEKLRREERDRVKKTKINKKKETDEE